MRGYSGDTLASALLGKGQVLMGRSFKYHRPRGVVTSGPEEPNALVGLGRDGSFEPNVRATTTELFEGLEATSQNHWPSLEHDVGAISSVLSRFLPSGFYYKTFLWPRAFWKHVYEPAIRLAAGLGRPPRRRDADHYEHFNITTELYLSLVEEYQGLLRRSRLRRRVWTCCWSSRRPLGVAGLRSTAPALTD